MRTEKKRKKAGLLYRIVTILLLLIIAFCLYKIGTILYEYYEGTRQYSEVQRLAGAEDGEEPETINFAGLRKENKDVKAWIYAKDTVINYPVVQGKDNSYYLYRMFNGAYNGKGSIFIDYRCRNPFNEFNTILYGHRMKDGSMFHSLTKYEDQSYFEKHKTMELMTPEEEYQLKIFAAVRIPSDSRM